MNSTYAALFLHRLRELAPHLFRALAVLALAAFGAACGDSDGSDDPDTDIDAGDVGEDTDTEDDVDADTDTDTDTVECTPGTEDCACDEGACEGELSCENNVCVAEEACTPGTTDCQCTGAGACLDEGDECVADVCVPRTSCDGELGCACDMGACDEGLACVENTCTVAGAVTVEIAGAGLRACDILLNTPELVAAEVSYPAGVRGRDRTRPSTTSLAVIRTEDTDLTGPVATIVFDAEVEDTSTISVSASCFDRLGAPVADATPTVR